MSTNAEAAKTVTTVSFPIMGILGIVFITLKLCGVIAWSWWWVTAPFWAPITIILVIALFALAGAFFLTRRR